MPDHNNPTHVAMDEIALEVGRALHAWSLVEEQLNILFDVASEISDSAKAHIIMSFVVNLRDRLKMCDYFVRAWIKCENDLNIWTKLMKKVERAIESRNKLAHASIRIHKDDPQSKPKLVPFFSYGTAIRERISPLSYEDIREFSLKFGQIRLALEWITNRIFEMRRSKELKQDYFVNDTPPPLIVEINESMRKARAST